MHPEKKWYPHTFEILFKDKDGKNTIVARAVKVTKNNFFRLGRWADAVGSARYNEKTQTVSHQKVSSIKTPKGLRTAYVGDYIARRVFPHEVTGMRTVEFYVIKEEDFYKNVI